MGFSRPFSEDRRALPLYVTLLRAVGDLICARSGVTGSSTLQTFRAGPCLYCPLGHFH